MINRTVINRSLLLALVFVFTLSASPFQAAGATAVINKVAAVVNGEMITMFDVQKISMQEINNQGLFGNDPSSEFKRQAIYKEVLDNMIMDILVRQEATRFKVSVTDAEVDNEIRMMAQRSQLTPKQFEDQLIFQGTSLPQFKEQVHNNILRQRMISLMVGRKVMVTREEVERYYREHQSEFTSEDEVELSMIVCKPDMDEETVAGLIKSGEISFAEAAKVYSSAPNAAYGGSLGAIPLRDLNPDWRNAIENLKPGETTIVSGDGGSPVMLHVDSRTGGQAKSLDEVAAQIENTLREPLLTERFGEFVEQLRSRAVVDIRM